MLVFCSLRHIALVVLFVAALGISGCGGARSVQDSVDEKLSAVSSVEEATSLFGEPDARVVQADGMIRHSWIISREKFIDGHEVYLTNPYTFKSPGGFRTDGDIRYRQYVPPHSIRASCNFVIVTKESGAVQDVSWQGNSCETLFQRKLLLQHNRKLNSLPPQPR